MFVDKCLGSSIREEISSRTRAALSMEGFPKSSLVPVGQEAGRSYRGRGVGWGVVGRRARRIYSSSEVEGRGRYNLRE